MHRELHTRYLATMRIVAEALERSFIQHISLHQNRLYYHIFCDDPLQMQSYQQELTKGVYGI